MKPRVLFIALDGATPAIISPLLDRGELPHLRSIIEGGATGTLRASPPLVRSMVWTTLATGTQAPAHGVCGDIAVRPDGAGVQAAGHRAWRARALWEMLTAAGLSCATVGWPASAPATSWASGAFVDETFAEPLGRTFDGWSLLPDCVSPADWRDTVRDLRVHPADITGEQIAALVPNARLVDQDNDPRLTRAALALARSSTIHAVGTHLASERDWDFLAVVYPLLADIQREFLASRSPSPSGVKDPDANVYGPVTDIAYRIQDAMLGTLLERIDASTTVLVVSPYGFATGADRPSARSAVRFPASITWHRPLGFLAARGPDIEADVLVHGARVQDIAPTILNMVGVEAPLLDGRSIEMLSKRPAVSSVPGFARPDEVPRDAWPDAVGADLEPDLRALVERAAIAWIANAAEAHLALRDFAQAAKAYERVIELWPDEWLAKARLANCCFHLGELERCRAIAGELISAKPDLPWGYLLGAAGLIVDGKSENVDDYLAKALETGRTLPNVSMRLAMLRLLRQEWTEAEALFRQVLEIMPQSVEAHDGLGSALLAQGRHEEAVATFRAGLGHVFHYPLAHLHLAVALASLRRWQEASEAAQVAISQDPFVPGGEALLDRISHAMRADEALKRAQSRGEPTPVLRKRPDGRRP